ncbi:MAG TPA: hypothetical protein PLH37_02160 [bacterium]|nr:hypothetical protein [bacterium]
MKKIFFLFLLICFLITPIIVKADNLYDFVITDITLEGADELWVYFQNTGSNTAFGKLSIEIIDLDTNESYYQENEQMYWTNTAYKFYLGVLKNSNRSSYRLQAIIDPHNFFSESNENNNSVIKKFYKPVPVCTEDDSGRNYSQAGSANGVAEWGKDLPVSNFNDSCLSGIKLNEFFCGTDKYVYQESYDCPNGCSNGVCLDKNKETDLAIQNIQSIDLRKTGGQFDWQVKFSAINLGEATPGTSFKIIGKNLTNGQILGETTPDSGEFKSNFLLSSPGYYFEGRIGQEFIYGINNIEICIDANNIITESNENNNCLIKQVDFTQYNIDKIFAKRLAGRLLLQVQKGGAIWYIDTKNYQRHSVTWQNALSLFQKFAVGISDENLLKIPADISSINPLLDTDWDGFNDITELKNGYSPYTSGPGIDKFKTNKIFANKFKGKFLLQVNQGGAIWYVDFKGVRHNIRWNSLVDIFTKLALGITDADLEKIEVAP